MTGRRRAADALLAAWAAACALLAAGVLAGIVLAIGWRGLPALDWSFLTEGLREAGASGGVFYHTLGTLILIATALAVALPPALGLALLMGFYLPRRARGRRALALFLHLLNGTPSILFGLFGMLLFVGWLAWGKSWLTGGILLGVMIVPTLAVALVERIESLPREQLEAAAGLGLRPWQIAGSVVLPQCLGGLVTGSLLGLARAAGETAPILFTATVFAGATLPTGIRESPVLTLPYHIFVLAQDSLDPAAAEKVWGAALLLLSLALGLSLLALPLRLRAGVRRG